MRSIFKKVIIVSLVLLMVFSLFSCSEQDGDIPEGMQIASVEGVPFKLYVPKNWAINYGNGVSGAYLSSSAGISVTVDVFDCNGKELDEFAESSIEDYKNTLDSFEIISEISDTTLDMRAAKKVKFSAEYEGAKYAFMRVFAKYSDNFIVFSYKSSKDYFDIYLPEAEAMLEVFKFCEPTNENSADKTDKDTPEGMKIASGEDVEYRFYVPTSWVLDTDESVATAYASEADRSNVSLTSYTPSVSLSIDGYFEMCETEYEKIYENYQRKEDASEIQMAGKLAKDYRFSFEYNGEQYKSRQVICIYRGMFYIMTYTAKAENYDLHTEDVEKIISEITFR